MLRGLPLFLGLYLTIFFQAALAISIQDEGAKSVVRSKDSSTEIQGSAGFETSYFPSPIPGNSKLSQSVLALVRFDLKSDFERLQSNIDVTVGKYVDWGSSFFSPKEFYISHPGAHNQTSVGRKLEFWSEVDKNWNLGMWQPQYKFEPLRPFEQGLFGVFNATKFGAFDLLIFMSPLTIPTTGPDIKEQDGNLVSDSRWYQQPSSSGVLLGQNTKLVYSLSMPPLTELMNHGGAGLRVGWNVSNPSGIWGSANYGYKPINTLLLKYDANLLVSSKTSEVMVSPVVAMHHIFGADMGYRFEKSKISLSYLEENPSHELPINQNGTDWWQQQAGEAKIYSAHYEASLNAPRVLEEVYLAVDYLKAEEKKTNDVDSTGVVRSAMLPYRLLFNNALSVEAKIPVSYRGKKVVANLKAIRDFDQKGTVYRTQFDYLYTKQWDVAFGLEAIVPDDSNDTNTDTHFINLFRANDRLYTGVNYVF